MKKFPDNHTKQLLKNAYYAAQRSPDRSTQNGATLVREGVTILTDCNRFPDGVEEAPERFERPLKYAFTEHAERNVIYKAARKGIRTKGLVMVCTWVPCVDCARAIIQAGIKTFITHKQACDKLPDHWEESIEQALDMLREAGVNVVMYDGKVGAEPVLCVGNRWSP